VLQYLVYDRLIFDKTIRRIGQYLDPATTVGADLDINIENLLEVLCLYALRVQFIALRLSAGDFFSGPDGLPLLPGVSSDRNRLLARSGVPAKTPWNRVRACPGLDPGFTPGFGTSAASLARKSIG